MTDQPQNLADYLEQRIAALEQAHAKAVDTFRTWQLKAEEVGGALSELRLLRARLVSQPTPSTPSTPPER